MSTLPRVSQIFSSEVRYWREMFVRSSVATAVISENGERHHQNLQFLKMYEADPSTIEDLLQESALKLAMSEIYGKPAGTQHGPWPIEIRGRLFRCMLTIVAGRKNDRHFMLEIQDRQELRAETLARILFVDDDDERRVECSEVLRNAGYCVMDVSGYRTADRMALDFKPDLLIANYLLDDLPFAMPIQFGSAHLFDTLKTRQRAIKVIYFGKHDGMPDDNLLPYGFDVKDLLKKVNRIFGLIATPNS